NIMALHSTGVSSPLYLSITYLPINHKKTPPLTFVVKVGLQVSGDGKQETDENRSGRTGMGRNGSGATAIAGCVGFS
ncbi:MAG: hypothetical protein LBL72_04795, partial [Candidatus Accumulibacter sp.]|nr:hypothetical protein [Accumulibacter sp.]